MSQSKDNKVRDDHTRRHPPTRHPPNVIVQTGSERETGKEACADHLQPQEKDTRLRYGIHQVG